MKTKTKSPARVSIAVLVEGGIVQEVRSTTSFDLVIVDLDNPDADSAVLRSAWGKIARKHSFTR